MASPATSPTPTAHGFEGLVRPEVDARPHDPTSTHLLHQGERLLDRHAAAPPAILRTAEGDYRVARIDQIVNLDVRLVEAFSKALQERSNPVVPAIGSAQECSWVDDPL